MKIKKNQQVKVSAKAPNYRRMIGYFQFFCEEEGYAVVTDKPLVMGGCGIYFVVAMKHLEQNVS